MTFVLIDLSSIAYPLWHLHGGSANPNETSQQIVARVLALASGAPHVAVCMDAGKSFRHELSTLYKANRPEREEALHHQIRLAVEALQADGFPIWRVSGFEADDVIATATAKAMEIPDASVIVVTADKDLMQLVCDDVTVKLARDGSLMDAAAVAHKFGVRPDQMRDYLTLVGDASDNIKGVKGVGEKRAAALLATHGTIAALYEAIDASAFVDGLTPAIRTALQEFRPNLDTTRQLVTLRTDVELPFHEITVERVPKALEAIEDDMDIETEEPEVSEQPTTAAAPAPVTAIAVREPDVLAPAPAEWERQLEPRSMNEAKVLAKNMHDSRLFMGAYGTPQAVLSTIIAGRELGLQAMASLRAIHIVEGRPTLSADLIRAMVIRSGLAKYFRCTERTAKVATFETQRGDDPPISLSYTIEEATAAGLVKPKSGWEKSPADMLVARAGSKLARLVYPDVVHGIYTAEEVQDAQNSEAVA